MVYLRSSAVMLSSSEPRMLDRQKQDFNLHINDQGRVIYFRFACSTMLPSKMICYRRPSGFFTEYATNNKTSPVKPRY